MPNPDSRLPIPDSHVERASAFLYSGLWLVLTRLFLVPRDPPSMPVGAHEIIGAFRPAPGYLRYVKLYFWLGLTAIDIALTALWLGLTVTVPWLGLLLAIPALIIIVLPDILAYIAIHLRYDTTWYVLTDRAMRLRRGVLHLTETTITYENVQNVTVEQGPIQRYFNIADLVVHTAGGGGGGGGGHGKHGGGGGVGHLGRIEGVDNANHIRDLIMTRVRASRSAGLGDEHHAHAESSDHPHTHAHTPAWTPAHLTALPTNPQHAARGEVTATHCSATGCRSVGRRSSEHAQHNTQASHCAQVARNVAVRRVGVEPGNDMGDCRLQPGRIALSARCYRISGTLAIPPNRYTKARLARGSGTQVRHRGLLLGTDRDHLCDKRLARRRANAVNYRVFDASCRDWYSLPVSPKLDVGVAEFRWNAWRRVWRALYPGRQVQLSRPSRHAQVARLRPQHHLLRRPRLVPLATPPRPPPHSPPPRRQMPPLRLQPRRPPPNHPLPRVRHPPQARTRALTVAIPILRRPRSGRHTHSPGREPRVRVAPSAKPTEWATHADHRNHVTPAGRAFLRLSVLPGGWLQEGGFSLPALAKRHPPISAVDSALNEPPPRILILTASVGAGHIRAAEAVELALKQLAPDAFVKNVDLMTCATAAFRRMYSKWYLDLVSKAPHLLGYFYDLTDRAPSPRSKRDQFRLMVERANLTKLNPILEDPQGWDIVVNTHFLPAEIIARLRRKKKWITREAASHADRPGSKPLATRTHVPQHTVVTDFDAHGLWANDPTDHYYVATDEAALSLQRWSVNPDRISITGIPIHPVFAQSTNPKACRAKHSLSQDRPVILLLAGGFGVGPIEQLFEAALTVEKPIHLAVVCGKNEALKKALEKAAIPSRHKAKVIGFTKEMDELMAAADIVVSKPGGLTTSEILARGAAMAIVNPIPGQESRNSDYLLEHGAAIKINSAAVLPHKLNQLLATPARLSALRANAKSLGHPRAAFDVARAVLAASESD